MTNPRHAIIIGAGPAGLSLAGLLAQHGWHCDIYEAASEMSVSHTLPHYLERAYGISCQVRALRVIQRLKALQDILQAGGYWREATYRHDAACGACLSSSSRRGRPHETNDDNNDVDAFRTLSCLRTELVAGLLSALRRQWKDRIHIHWECPVQSIQRMNHHHHPSNNDKDDKLSIVLPDASQRQADVIVCADGSHSPIGRTSLAAFLPSCTITTQSSGFSTRTLLLRHDDDITITRLDNNTTQPWIPTPNSLHFIISRHTNKDRLLLLGRHTGPRPSSPALSSTTLEGGGGGGMIQTMIVYPDSHAQLASSQLTWETLQSVLTQAFTTAQLPLQAAATEEQLRLCASSAGAALPGTVQCSQYHFRNMVLIGDAAHCSPANNAQGVNVAMEDAAILADLLCFSDDDDDGESRSTTQQPSDSQQIESQLAKFTQIRKPEMDALQRMLRHPFYESTRPTWRRRVVTDLHHWTGIPALRPMTDQVYQVQCSLVTCERHMLLQYHLPVVLAALSLVLVGYVLVLVVNLVVQGFTKRTAPKV